MVRYPCTNTMTGEELPMTTPERPGDWPYGGAAHPAAGQQPHAEPPIAGMPYNAPPPSGEVPVAGFQYNPQAAPPPQPYYPPPQQPYQPGPYQQPYGYNPYAR